MDPVPTVSVIIPTYNRIEALLGALDSLRQQTFPLDQLEVIVVDDGSTDDSPTVASRQFPFTLHYLQQKNQGATAARNLGASFSHSDVLVFMDDDITISGPTLEALADKCVQSTKVIVMGTISKRSPVNASVYTSIVAGAAADALVADDKAEFHPVDCNSELLACRRTDYFDIGKFQDPTEGNGWPNWDDVDFGYRAHLKGFRLVGTSKAFAEHWDYSVASRTLACQRFYRAGRSAVWLFKRHPELRTLIPMLYDKTPPAWGQDSVFLIARKLIRRMVSSPPVLNSLEKLANILEQRYPSPPLLRRLYNLLHGANLLQGYRKGLSEYGLAGAQA